MGFEEAFVYELSGKTDILPLTCASVLVDLKVNQFHGVESCLKS
jgi:hypothetical protein